MVLGLQVGKAPLAQRDQGARSTGDKDVQKVQEPASKAYRDTAADAAEFQARFCAPPSRSTSPFITPCVSSIVLREGF